MEVRRVELGIVHEWYDTEVRHRTQMEETEEKRGSKGKKDRRIFIESVGTDSNSQGP